MKSATGHEQASGHRQVDESIAAERAGLMIRAESAIQGPFFKRRMDC
jgi:hypothetical protein